MGAAGDAFGVNSDLYDVADSTDWLPTPLSSLSPVEAALRCHVCKDFYNTPMITSCHHTFCSLCIRRALSNDGTCPLCRAKDQEMKLRNNWSMGEAVEAFVKARPHLLRFAREPAPSSPKRKLSEYNSSHENGGSPVQDSESPARKRRRTSARLSKPRAPEATATAALHEASIPDAIDEDNFEPDDGLVACPICTRRMKPIQVDKHLDTSCPGMFAQTTPQKPSAGPSEPKNTPSVWGWQGSQQGPPRTAPERLPALNYSMLRENALRKKMRELGISDGGSRSLLERRHKEWVTIWNANCDSPRPKKRADLLQDLDTWERTQGSRAPVASRSVQLGAQIRDKEFDGAAWSARHGDSFKDLIASARKTRAKAGQKTQPAESSLQTGSPLGCEAASREKEPPTTRRSENEDAQQSGDISRAILHQRYHNDAALACRPDADQDVSQTGIRVAFDAGPGLG